MYKPSEKEVSALNKKPSKVRRDYSIKKIADWEEIYVLKDEHSQLAYGDIDGHLVIPIWPSLIMANGNAVEQWDNFSGHSYSIEDFFKLFEREEKNVELLISLYPINGESGFVMSLEEFMRDLLIELRKYE